MKKRIFSLLLAVCMITNLMPMSALTVEGLSQAPSSGASSSGDVTSSSDASSSGGASSSGDVTSSSGASSSGDATSSSDAASSGGASSSGDVTSSSGASSSGDVSSSSGASSSSDVTSSSGASSSSNASSSSGAAQACICTVKCTAADASTGTKASINASCPVCAAVGANPALCTGEAPIAKMSPMARAGSWLGSGTEGDPYQIADVDDLIVLPIAVNNGTNYSGFFFKLTADINLADVEWTPIGTSELGYDTNSFKGNFNGNKHVVQNLKIKSDVTVNVGLFGCVGTGGTVQNLSVTGSVRGSGTVGAVVGRNYGKVINCSATADVIGADTNASDGHIGGIVGYNVNGTVEGCYSTGTVSGYNFVGGIAGNNGGTVKGCYSTGTVSGYQNVGGIAGRNEGGTVEGCYSTSTVIGTENIGGIVGNQSNTAATVKNCVSLGTDVVRSGSKSAAFGRVIGLKNDGSASGNKARSDMAVISGLVIGGTDTDINGADVAIGDVQATVFDAAAFPSAAWAIPDAGNLAIKGALPTLVSAAGTQSPTLPTVASAMWEGSGTKAAPYIISNVAGLTALATNVNNGTTGYGNIFFKLSASITLDSTWVPIGIYTGNYKNRKFQGNFDGNNQVITFNITTGSAGGLGVFRCVGDGGTVKNLGVAGTVTGSNDIGGIVSVNEGTVESCYSTANITGTDFVGGIVGNNSGTVKHCYNTGTVSGGTNVGGIAGNSSGPVESCYSTGTASGSSNVGGIAGKTGYIYNKGTLLQSCISLGARVIRAGSGKEDTFGRVLGDGLHDNPKSNKARADMLRMGALVTGGLVTDKNGADVAVNGTVALSAVFDAAAFPADIWEIPTSNLKGNEALPTLKNAKASAAPTLLVLPILSLDDEAVTAIEGKTYTVSTAEGLVRLATLVNAAGGAITGYVINLQNDIDLSKVASWVPIGKDTNNQRFNGTFNGGGHTITLKFTSAEKCVGLFGSLGKEGIISKVGVTGTQVRTLLPKAKLAA